MISKFRITGNHLHAQFFYFPQHGTNWNKWTRKLRWLVLCDSHNKHKILKQSLLETIIIWLYFGSFYVCIRFYTHLYKDMFTLSTRFQSAHGFTLHMVSLYTWSHSAKQFTLHLVSLCTMVPLINWPHSAHCIIKYMVSLSRG